MDVAQCWDITCFMCWLVNKKICISLVIFWLIFNGYQSCCFFCWFFRSSHALDASFSAVYFCGIEFRICWVISWLGCWVCCAVKRVGLVLGYLFVLKLHYIYHIQRCQPSLHSHVFCSSSPASYFILFSCHSKFVRDWWIPYFSCDSKFVRAWGICYLPVLNLSDWWICYFTCHSEFVRLMDMLSSCHSEFVRLMDMLSYLWF